MIIQSIFSTQIVGNDVHGPITQAFFHHFPRGRTSANNLRAKLAPSGMNFTVTTLWTARVDCDSWEAICK